MNIEQIREYCLSKKGTSEDFPFDEDTLVFKVLGKMFALTSLKKWEEGDYSINLKCDQDYAEELRTQYDSIYAGYHMNKKHWITVLMDGSVPDKKLCLWMDDSYNLVVAGLTKSQKKALETL